MAEEVGHHSSRSYADQNGDFHLNGGAFYNDAEIDISGSMETAATGAQVFSVQTIDMADAQVVLTMVAGAPTGTLMTGNILYVDPNSGGASEDLLLPYEADCTGMFAIIVNTGGEGIVVKEDGDSTTIITLDTAQHGIVVCDGTTWLGFMGAVT